MKTEDTKSKIEIKDTNTKLAIKVNQKTNVSSFTCVSKKINFPNNLPCEILDLNINLDRSSSENGSEETGESKVRYTGGISGVFSVPEKKFSQPFGFKIPFSIKFGTAIAFSFTTRESENEKLATLNKFVFGDEVAKPIVITKEIAVEIATFLINQSKGMEGLKNYWQKAIDFLNNNNISLNFLIDYSEKKFQVGFYWEEFKLEGLPEQFKLKDILFGLSLNFNPKSENKFALKVGGKAVYGNDEKNQLYLEYERDSNDQRLEFGGTISVLTSILQKMQVNIPDQILDFSENASISIEYISDVGKKISDEMKLS